ncbi:MAG TPA: type II toxin-antitoxin system HipA family toxin [Kofleriaceae bacterium]|jgi:serine/threonine-protein kinase HipA
MSERELRVFIDAAAGDAPVGRLWTRTRNGRDSASFEYDAEWLANPAGFALDPELPLERGAFNTSRPLFNAFTDTSPDRWGQTLLRRAERRRARAEHRTPRTLGTSDFLTLVTDETRAGALRFRAPGSDEPLTMSATPVPPLVKLSQLLSASDHVVADDESDDDLRLLLAPGTSLGGARPKASVRDKDGTLAIAKFPKADDDWPVTRWEATTLALARAAKIDVPAARLVSAAKRPVLLVARFDRAGARRIACQSALTAVAGTDGEAAERSYLDIADALATTGADPARDLAQLYRRVVFNVLVSNTDDHLRNHGFVRAAGGWRLSPAYDLNPMPVDVKARAHALALDATTHDASLEVVRATARRYRLAAKDERAIVREVAKAVSRWRAVAGEHGLGAGHCDRMESAFEHPDLHAAKAV